MNELIPYTEARRDQLERQLAEDANKREINHRTNNGITVIAYWMVAENVCTIWVSDERTNTSVEFGVENDEVMEYFTHPFAHPDANMPHYSQRMNDGA